MLTNPLLLWVEALHRYFGPESLATILTLPLLPKNHGRDISGLGELPGCGAAFRHPPLSSPTTPTSPTPSHPPIPSTWEQLQLLSSSWVLARYRTRLCVMLCLLHRFYLTMERWQNLKDVSWKAPPPCIGVDTYSFDSYVLCSPFKSCNRAI